MMLLCLFSSFLWAEHEHFTGKEIGEYYEFDTEGTRFDQFRHAITFHTKRVVKIPFRVTRFGFHTTKNIIKRSLREIELFLSPSRSIHGRRTQLREALGEWATDPMVENYLLERDRAAGRNLLLGIPNDVATLLRNSLYSVGIRLPRSAWRTLRSFARGTFDCARI